MLQPKYERLTSVKDGVVRLLTIRDYAIPEFDVLPKAEGDYTKTLVLEGKRIPLLSWRYEPRMNAIRNYGKKAEENCCINVSSFFGKDTTYTVALYQAKEDASITEAMWSYKKTPASKDQNLERIATVTIVTDNKTGDVLHFERSSVE